MMMGRRDLRSYVRHDAVKKPFAELYGAPSSSLRRRAAAYSENSNGLFFDFAARGNLCRQGRAAVLLPLVRLSNFRRTPLDRFAVAKFEYFFPFYETVTL